MLTPYDHQMFHHAAQRGQVIVTTEDRQTLATLVTWRPIRNGTRTKVARVQFRSGRSATIRIERITVPQTVAA